MNKLFSNNMKEKGQGLVEYAIILALVAIVVIGSMRILGPKVGDTFSSINNSLTLDDGGSQAANPPAAPTMTYQEWCDSLGAPYHMNGGGVCVKGN
jgi:pilus assembly protein Flp/PilA